MKSIDGKFVGKYPTKWRGDCNWSALQLTSLKGAPIKVSGWVQCSNNNLTSLEGAPRSVRDSFFCSDNKLTSLNEAPIFIGGGLYCHINNISSIQNINHCIKVIGTHFISDDNLTGLISLLMIEQPPKYVDIGPLSVIFNDALSKIHSGRDRMDVIMEVILNCPDEHAWQLGEIE